MCVIYFGLLLRKVLTSPQSVLSCICIFIFLSLAISILCSQKTRTNNKTGDWEFKSENEKGRRRVVWRCSLLVRVINVGRARIKDDEDEDSKRASQQAIDRRKRERKRERERRSRYCLSSHRDCDCRTVASAPSSLLSKKRYPLGFFSSLFLPQRRASGGERWNELLNRRRRHQGSRYYCIANFERG